MVAAGRYARGGPSYKYQRGSDSRQYAVGGEVQMDMSPIPGSPEATIQKMQTIKRAALAPATPSSQDHKVAATAETKASQARQEFLKQLNAAKTNPDGSNVQSEGV